MQFAGFEQNGFGILENVLDAETVSRLITEVSKLKPSNSGSRKNESVYGVRNLLNLSPAIKEFSQSEIIKNIAKNILAKTPKSFAQFSLIKLPMPTGKCRGIRI